MRLRTLAAALAAAALGVSASAAHASNVLVNPGFETGDFSGWTNAGNTGYTEITWDAHAGDYAAQFGAVGSDGILSQTVATTPGQTFDLSFWLANDGGATTHFSASFDGVTLFDAYDLPGQGYTQYTYSVTASSSSAALVFDFRQDPAYFYFDDVSLSPTESLVGNVNALFAAPPAAPAAAPLPSSATAGLALLGVMALPVARRAYGRRPATA